MKVFILKTKNEEGFIFEPSSIKIIFITPSFLLLLSLRHNVDTINGMHQQRHNVDTINGMHQQTVDFN
jgi:hypothetical protein